MPKKEKKEYLTFSEALLRLQKYCVYQDRCHQEVRSKLIELGVYGDELEQVMAALISENFLNEERFARSYARGKFRMRGWGRKKILLELKRRKISEYCIRKAMTEIEEDDYQQRLEDLLEKKNKFLRESDPYKRKQKLARYIIQRGYESDKAWIAVKKLLDA